MDPVGDGETGIGLQPEEPFALDEKFAIGCLSMERGRRADRPFVSIMDALRGLDDQFAIAVFAKSLQFGFGNQGVSSRQALHFGTFEDRFHLSLMRRVIRISEFERFYYANILAASNSAEERKSQ